MLVNTAQCHFPFERSSHNMRQGPASYHRRSVSCVAVASHHEHYQKPSYPTGRYYDTIEITEASTESSSASPSTSRHGQRKSDISLGQLQRSLSSACLSNPATTTEVAETPEGATVNVATGSLGGKLVKVNPVPGPRRSLLSDLLNNQGSPSRLEQNANRRRMLKSMRRYSVDASEMNFNLGLPTAAISPLKGIPSEGEGVETPTVRYLRNPCHATVKTKLQVIQSARRGVDDNDSDTPDYFGTEDRVW
ncbi:hypothetical protein CPB97_004045 [Podila verticillata]|nr:hypothetical protein CPB97_004045 [Podila verticillata]